MIIQTSNYADLQRLVSGTLNGMFYFDDSSNVFKVWAFTSFGATAVCAVLTLSAKPGSFNTDFVHAAAVNAPLDV